MGINEEKWCREKNRCRDAMKKSPMPGKPQKIKKESEGYGDINK